jgi:hypothetical protein
MQARVTRCLAKVVDEISYIEQSVKELITLTCIDSRRLVLWRIIVHLKVISEKKIF